LRRAAESGDIEKVKDLLGRRASVHERDRYGGYTPLHYAASVAIARLLLEANADAEEKSYAGTTPLQLAERRGNSDLVRLLRQVEVEEHVREERLEVKRQAAADELARALISRGIPDMTALETAQPEVLAELRQDERLRTLLVQACAVQEAEVLLGAKSAMGQRPHAELVEHLQKDELDKARDLLDDGAVDLFQRDPLGNVPAHHCASISGYRMVIAKAPRTAAIANKRGKTPLVRLLGKKLSIETLRDVWSGGAMPPGEGERWALGPEAAALLRLDGAGVSLCMRAEGKAKEWMLEQVSPWEEFQRAFKLPDSLPDSLRRVVPSGSWEDVLCLHLFGEAEVWRDGKLTAQCQARLEEMWQCMKQLMQRAFRRNPEAEARQAMATVRKLLDASRGPQKLADARESYRKELSLEMLHHAMQSEAIHSILYDMMSGPGSSWLKSFPDDRTWERVDPFGKLKPDPLQQHRDRPKLRNTSELAEGGRHLAAPGWVHPAMELDLSQVLKDLRHVGGKDLQDCFGEEAFGDQDAIYRMLAGRHGFGPDAFPARLSSFCEPSTIFWYCLWTRGLCHGRHETISKGLVSLLQGVDPPPVLVGSADDHADAVLAGSGVVGLQDLCERVLEEMQDIYAEIRESLVPEGQEGGEASLLARALMAAAPSFVLSANRIAFAVEHEAGIVEAFEVLRQRPGGVLQVRNGFNKKARVGDECRSLQVWVPVKTDRYGPLLAEVTFLLADDHIENSWHRLSLEYFRGVFDRHSPPKRPTLEQLETNIKTRFVLNPSLIPESKSKDHDGEVDEETARKMRELAELKAKEAERKAQEEARRKREELERKLKEASANFDPADCVVVGDMTFRPPVEVLPKTRRNEALEMKKLEKFNAKKAAAGEAAEAAAAAAAFAEAEADAQEGAGDEEGN